MIKRRKRLIAAVACVCMIGQMCTGVSAEELENSKVSAQENIVDTGTQEQKIELNSSLESYFEDDQVVEQIENLEITSMEGYLLTEADLQYLSAHFFNLKKLDVTQCGFDSKETYNAFQSYFEKHTDIKYFYTKIAENEENADYQWLNQYMASASPTTKNEYTGLFKDYNVILITAESFSPWAVDEKLTPTLYKMVHTGFVMNNFYIPAFNNTSDGEYMVCTGLIPNGQGNHSFQDTADNDMALCFGNILGPLGYSTNAYHPHTYTFYERDQTHPNMGYTYKGYGNGLDVTYQWPESDLEMMEKSMDRQRTYGLHLY